MPVALALPVVEDETFLHSPLRSMLGQVRFPTILSIADRDFVAPLQESLRGEYPDLEREDEVGLLVSEEGTYKTEASRRWRFVGRAGWSLVLAQEFLTIQVEEAAYTRYSEFQSRFRAAWDAVLAHLHPPYVTQQGLRYINHIRSNDQDLKSFVRDELLGVVGNVVLGDELAHSLTEFRLNRPDGVLAVKHGVVQAGPDRTVGYLLDFDYFTQTPGEATDTRSLMQRFDAYHEVIYQLFRWCLSEQGTRRLRGH